MAWTTMHFAVGMAGATVATGVGCMIMRRGWRWLPLSMTAGGLWAVIPDAPRLFREDFPWLPFAQTLGSKSLELKLHRMGDFFFFHKQLDIQPNEYALHGLLLMLLMYNIAIVVLMLLEYCQRNSPIHRSFRAHEPHVKPAYPRTARAKEYQQPQLALASSAMPPMPPGIAPDAPHFTTHVAPGPPPGSQSMSLEEQFEGGPSVEIAVDPDNPIIGRIGRKNGKTGS
ncbi:MAG TPA: hypothetical protein DCM28_13555 [Phycisphaerales bacterium]|nr:hypothetical protein [Phycisphaerales bacterium]HCD32082.1 hypothetical protein [Phycisphaerales bacterium]|tara:strand:+ start:1477 stop:2157 length:681 start_codon:yes stop_codon:yes gene_type:complete